MGLLSGPGWSDTAERPDPQPGGGGYDRGPDPAVGYRNRRAERQRFDWERADTAEFRDMVRRRLRWLMIGVFVPLAVEGIFALWMLSVLADLTGGGR